MPFLNPFHALRHRNFRIFWLGQTASLVGTWMQSMAQGWLALELSDSPFLVGLVTSLGSLPVLLFSLHAGVLADRSDRLRLVTVMQGFLLLEAALLWWLVWSGGITIGRLIALAAFAGVCNAFEIPARQSLTVELVDREDLQGAIALNSSGFNLARIVGPGIAAAVIAQFGIAWCFGLNALSYLAVLGGLLLIRLPAAERAPLTGSAMAGVRDGLDYMRRTREVNVLMRMVTVFSIFGIPYLIMMPVFARDLLGLGASGYGLLLACVGIGGLVGALALAAVGGRVRRGRLLAVSAYAFPLTLLLLAVTRDVRVAVPVLLLAGFTMILNNALSNGMLQSLVRDEYRGRLMAAYSLVVVGLSQVVGAFLAGTVARLTRVDVSIAAGALVMLLYATWAYRRHPEIRAL